MRRRSVPRSLRHAIRERALNRCEYCRHPATFSSAPCVCEHVIPRAMGGGDSLEELAWSCPACNTRKCDKTQAPDPQTQRGVPLSNPRLDQWSRHFRWSADGLLMIGRTDIGRATVDALQLNRPEVINLRRALKALGEHPP
ncbi:MAG: HNH endonuclease [Armatimonadetes bacterium]|nr:HNH endonuclease [Armatimonadota bacterium]